MKIVPATHEIVSRYYGVPPRYSLRAWAAVDGDQVLGVGGMCVTQQVLVMFLGMNDGLREYFLRSPLALVRGVRRLQKQATEKGLRLQAEADASIPCSARFLERMGFVKQNGSGVYLWP